MCPTGKSSTECELLHTLARIRALKSQLCLEPAKICRDYQQRWEDDLGTAGKPWKWTDVNKAINFGKVKSMKRVHAMFCHVLEADMAGRRSSMSGLSWFSASSPSTSSPNRAIGARRGR